MWGCFGSVFIFGYKYVDCVMFEMVYGRGFKEYGCVRIFLPIFWFSFVSFSYPYSILVSFPTLVLFVRIHIFVRHGTNTSFSHSFFYIHTQKRTRHKHSDGNNFPKKKGGVGKSTVAINLAYELARMGGRIGKWRNGKRFVFFGRMFHLSCIYDAVREGFVRFFCLFG